MANSWLSLWSGKAALSSISLKKGQREIAGNAEDFARPVGPEGLQQGVGEVLYVNSFDAVIRAAWGKDRTHAKGG
jgi:hypothetical protein